MSEEKRGVLGGSKEEKGRPRLMISRITAGIGIVLFVVGAALAQTQELDSRLQALNSKIASIREKAEQGDPAAQTMLGMMFNYGQVVPPDYGKAMKWFRQAAEQGYAGAHSSISG